MESLFFELLQVAIGNRQCLSVIPTNEEWKLLFHISQKQSLTGIAFHGVKKLSKEQLPDRSLIFEWYSIAIQIQQQNALTTKVCNLLVHDLAQDGLRGCILKGQANHRYYDQELGMLRTCGDIDIWVSPKKTGLKHPVKEVINYFSDKDQQESLCYLHIEIKPVMNVPVEVHLRPSFMNAPFRNWRFQRLFGHSFDCDSKCVAVENVDGIIMHVLKIDYDVIFQLNHIYRHLLDEGIGLRQILDYYMLLSKWKNEHEMPQKELLYHIRRLGMIRFAKALMYVLKEAFMMPSEWMICDASVKDGRFLLSEILQSGNFGHYDSRLTKLNEQKGKTSYQLKRAWRRFVRNLNFLTSYPEEVLWEPIARVSHLWWRKFHLWKY